MIGCYNSKCNTDKKYQNFVNRTSKNASKKINKKFRFDFFFMNVVKCKAFRYANMMRIKGFLNSLHLNDSASRSLEKVSSYYQLSYQRMVFVLS